jgi:polysaccharide deacetylase 2 family uncharacterized protein YibQ
MAFERKLGFFIVLPFFLPLVARPAVFFYNDYMPFSKKKSTSKRKTQSRKRRTVHSRKPKIALNRNSVFVLTGIIALVCIALLVASAYLNAPHASSRSTPSQQKAPVADVLPQKQIASTEQDESVKQSAPAKQDESVKQSVPAKQDESVKQSVPAKQDESVKQSVPAKQDESVKQSVPAKQNEPARQSAPAKQNNSTKQSASVKQSAAAESSTKKIPAPSQSIKTPSAPEKGSSTPSGPIMPYDIPQAAKGATLIFIFDDAGQSVTKVKRYTSLPIPLTIAVLPQLPHSKECADVIRAAGKEVILHQPMQAENLKINPGAGAILPDMSTYQIATVLKKNLAEVGPVKGLNNHEGSLITEDEIKIGTVLDVAAEQGIYFIDSRTTAATKAPQAALERDMKIYERDVFLDDVVNKELILEQIYKALSIANKKGKTIIIGHVDKSSDIIPPLLRDMYPYLQQKGYRFATPSQIR